MTSGRPPRRPPSRPPSFELIHPSLLLGFFTAALALTMLAMQPVLLGISFAAALALSLYLRGWRSTLKTLAWQLPLILLCAALNPLLAATGSTELLRLGARAIYLEAIVFGACMGVMLATVMLWFLCAATLLTSDKVLAVLGGTLPTIGLLITMTLRLVPQFVERGRIIASTAGAVSRSRPQGLRAKASERLRIVSVLMGWSMEDSLETADAMRARGWGTHLKRTSYRRYRFAAFDLGASLVLATLLAISALCAWVACSQYHFYPQLSTLGLWWGYAPYAALMLTPLIFAFVEDVRWRRS